MIFVLIIGANTIQSLDIGNSGIPLSRRHRMIKKAAEISDKGMEAAYNTLKRVFTENITEAHVATAMHMSMIENGSNPGDPEAPAFYFVVAAGNDSVQPHGIPENDVDHVIKPGDVVVIDMGARYKGYVSDMTRTFFIGEPTELQKEVYNIVLEALEKTTAKIRSFIPYVKLEKTAREIIESYGYKEFRYFPHSVSHGLGFLVHAKIPEIAWIGYPRSYLPLLPGMVITVEPGIYIEEEGFGIRIEDDVAVRFFGGELLTHYPKELEDMIIHCDVPDFFDEVNIEIGETNVLELDSDGKINCSITVHNPSNMQIDVNFTVDEIPKGWTVDLTPGLIVKADSKTSENLIIQAPEDFDGTKTIDIAFSYHLSADSYIQGTPSTASVKLKSKTEDVISDSEYILIFVLIAILLIIAVVAIVLYSRKKPE